MNFKRLKSTAITLGIFLALFWVSYAVTTKVFDKKEIKISHVKGHIFEIDLIDLSGYLEADENTELLPGSTFTIKPVITNNGTDGLFCFIKITMSTVIENRKERPIFSYTVSDNWTLIKETFEEGKCTRIYAYVEGESVCYIAPTATTNPLTESMTLDIDNFSFFTLDDEQLDVVVKGVGVWSQAEDMPDKPLEAWNRYSYLASLNGEDE